jgi:hypothetical protein
LAAFEFGIGALFGFSVSGWVSARTGVGDAGVATERFVGRRSGNKRTASGSYGEDIDCSWNGPKPGCVCC